MTNELRVDPAAVQMAADHVDAAADAMRTEFSASHDRITAAQGGWIGQSGAALAATVSKWEADSAAHYGDLLANSTALRSAAASYVSTDDAQRANVEGTAARMGL